LENSVQVEKSSSFPLKRVYPTAAVLFSLACKNASMIVCFGVSCGKD
jgi:hypothetical protein